MVCVENDLFSNNLCLGLTMSWGVLLCASIQAEMAGQHPGQMDTRSRIGHTTDNYNREISQLVQALAGSITVNLRAQTRRHAAPKQRWV